MTREIKIGTAVAGSFLSLVGVVVGTKMYNGDVPKPIEGIAAVSDLKKELDPAKPAAPTAAPGILPAAFSSETPLPPPSASFPSAPPPASLTPPPFPPAAEFDLPKIPDPTKPLIDTASDLSKSIQDKIREQEQAARNVIEKSKNDLVNSGNNLINGANKKIEGFANDLNDKGNKLINDLPPVPSPGSFNLPPVVVADGTIVGGGTKPAPKNELPQPPNFTGNPPAVPEIPPTIVGGSQPPPPLSNPGVTTIKPKDPAPTPFGSETPKPPTGTTPLPPVGFPSGPTTPPPPSDIPLPPVTTPFGSSTTPPAPPKTPPAPPLGNGNDAPIVAPRNPEPTPPPPPVGNPFGTGNPQPPTVPVSPVTPVPTIPGPRTDVPPVPGVTFPQPPITQPTPPPPPTSGGFTPLVPPTAPVQPVVKTDNPQRYICQGNENYSLIAARTYGNENFARALEEYNRDLPNATDNVRAQPARLQPGTIVWLPAQIYLMDRYGRYIASASAVPPVASPPRPFGNEVGLNPPSPAGNKAPAPTDNAGVVSYRVPAAGMYLSQVAERQLGSPLRWIDIYRLNPGLQPEQPLREGSEIRVPAK